MAKDIKINLFKKKIKLADKIAFIQNLSVMIKSGIPIIDALDVIKEDLGDDALNDLVKRLSKNLQKGQNIHTSLKDEVDFLNQAHMGILEAGEISGQLYESLERIKTDLQKENDLFAKIKGALTYPAIILLALIGIGGGIVIFILPKIADIFTRMGIALPLPTRIMVGFGTFVSENMVMVILAVILLVVLMMMFIGSRTGRQVLLAFIARLPLVNQLIKDINLTRFSRTLGVLLLSGVNIDEALQVSARVFPNRVKEIIDSEVVEGVRKGDSLAESLKKKGINFPNILVSMIAVGESSGNLGEVLSELSDYFDRRVDSRLTILTNMLEPILMLVVGLAIGGAVLSIIAPIYNMVGTLQQTQF